MSREIQFRLIIASIHLSRQMTRRARSNLPKNRAEGTIAPPWAPHLRFDNVEMLTLEALHGVVMCRGKLAFVFADCVGFWFPGRDWIDKVSFPARKAWGSRGRRVALQKAQHALPGTR